MFKNLALFLILFYKKFFSGVLRTYLGGGCLFTPTCSEYSYQVIERYGLIKGGYLSLLRLIRCNPLSRFYS